MTHQEFRAFGPPGTGKTTWIAKQVQAALRKYHPDQIVCASFTRAAALELGGRDTGLPASNVGTIHSLCYHALGVPPIIEVDTGLRAEWNKEYPQWAIAGGAMDERPEPGQRPSNHLRDYNRQRACLELPHDDDEFVGEWEAFKADNEAIDFTDMLLRAPPDLGASVLIIDEAQDLTPLQWQVVRQWGSTADTFIVAGDDDQMLYDFLGASASTFLSPLPDDQIRVLGQSYRLPRAVFDCAERWVARLNGRRHPKPYQPRDADGLVAHRTGNDDGLRLADADPLAAEIGQRAADGQTVMVLASCGYMLRPLLTAMRTRGVPFANAYRPKRGDWNPLQRTGQRLQAFLRCARHVETDQQAQAPDWWAWVEMLRVDEALNRGAKQLVRARADAFPSGDHRVVPDDFEDWFTEETMMAVLQADTRWLAAHVTQRFAQALDYPLSVLSSHGAAGLLGAPLVTVGTIHSVKGGQADVVYLFPDLSQQARREIALRGQAARDALLRLFYVGMTRAREELHLCGRSGGYYANWIIP